MRKKIKWFLSVAICMLFISTAFFSGMGETLNVNENLDDDTEVVKYLNNDQNYWTNTPDVLSISTDNIGIRDVITGEIINKRVIAVPGSSILLVLWEKRLDNGEVVPFYGISLDGQSFVRTVWTSYILGLRYAHFDPLVWVPEVEPLLAADSNTRLFIVQFVTQPLEVFRDAITDLGGTVRHYVAQLAYLVEMNETVRMQVESLSYVRWVGLYHPAYRLEEFMIENLERAEQKYPLQRYNIQVLAIEQKNIVADRIKALGGTVDRADAGKYLLEATLTPEQLFTVVRWNEVLFVDRWSPYETDMNNARELGGANYIEAAAGYTGAGVRGEVFDNGFNLNHVDFASRPLIQHGTTGVNSHGASTSGICFGDGTGNIIARGLLPDGQGIVADYYYTSMTGPGRYTHTGELLQAPYYAVFQTASVGSDRTTQYTTLSADTDAMLFDFDITHCQSQSNAGNQMSRPQAWAKNIISVGGIRHFDTLTMLDDCWGCGSTAASIGPASDGRIKPDLSAFYDYIYTTTSGSPTAYTSTFGGTSGATPIVAGYVGLFFQMWADGIFGNPVLPPGTGPTGYDVFDNRAHMTTAKAALINTATQYPFSGSSHDLTRTHQGWGWPNIGDLYDMRDKIYIIDETDILEPFEVAQHIIVVNEPVLKITMTYADPPGNPSVQSQHRINDLTLKVISPTGTIYYGNNGLLDAYRSIPGGSPDTKNTVENVFIETPELGIWTVEIHADEIIQDSHVETPQLDADYALVITGVAAAEHDIAVANLDVPEVVPRNETVYVNATIRNCGINNESNIVVDFTVDGVVENSTVISTLNVGQSIVVSFEWIPSEVGTYNVGVEVQPVPGEEVLLNNALYATVEVIPSPDIWVDPTGFNFHLNEGVTFIDMLTVGNEATAEDPLEFDISYSGGGGWLSVVPEDGIVEVGDSTDLDVIINTDGLQEGVYNALIVVSSNDFYEPVVNIPVSLTIVFENDVGVIAVNYPTGIINAGSCTVNASIENFGSMNQTDVLVNCSIYDAMGLPYTEDFESDDGGYVHGGPTDLWEWGTPTAPDGPSSAHSGSYCWGTVLDGNYVNYADATLDSIPIALPTGFSAELSFWHWYDIESLWDGGNVKISSDGGNTWNILGSYLDPYNREAVSSSNAGIPGEPGFCGHGQGYWENVTFDLSNYEGEEVIIRWHFGSDRSNTYPGWYIDDVRVDIGGRGGSRSNNLIYSAQATVSVDAYSTASVEFTPPWEALPGTYGMRVITLLPGDQDPGNDRESMTVTVLDNWIPYAPTINGDTNGMEGTVYEYTLVTVDPDGDDVYYYIDWGDGIFNDWFGPFPSGVETTASHAWIESGVYQIRVRAKDEHGAESDWSASLWVRIFGVQERKAEGPESAPPMPP